MKIKSKNFVAEGTFDTAEKYDEKGYFAEIVPQGKMTLKSASVTFDFPFEKEDALFVNGYQSWTASAEHDVDWFDKSLRHCPSLLEKIYAFSYYSDLYFHKRVYRKGYTYGYTYAYVRRGENFLLFASCSEETGFTRIVFDTQAHTVTFEKDCAGRETETPFVLFDLYFGEGEENAVFDGWLQKYGKTAPTQEKVSGYTSWYNCYQDITEQRILSDLDGMRTLPVKPQIFQIDDGFETFVGDWLDADEKKFPHGMRPMADAIQKEGYRAGLWLAPFVCEKKSKLFAEHQDWLIKDQKEQPIRCCGNWSGAYALDIYNGEVREYIAKCIKTYRDAGFTLFKLDFLYAACIRSLPDKTHGEIMFDAMRFLREACGDAQILACGVPLAPAFSNVDYCRIGPDVSLSYDDKFYMRGLLAERVSTKNTILNTVYRRQLSGRVFLNDPDVFILRKNNNSLSEEQKRALGTVNGLFGGVLFASDEFALYDEEQKGLYRLFASLKDAEDVKVSRTGDRLDVSYRLDGQTYTLHHEI